MFLVRLWRQKLFGRAISAAWFAYGAALAIKDGLSDSAPPILLGLRQMMPSISLAWWLAGAAVVLLIWCFEASFRSQRDIESQLAAATNRFDEPSRLARERMAVALVEDRLKMIDLLESHTHDLISYKKDVSIVPVSLRSLAGRYTIDLKFAQSWNIYTKACLSFFQSVPPSGTNALLSAQQNHNVRERLLDEHREKYGMPLLEAKDELREALLNI
jgi:hypothetical protein